MSGDYPTCGATTRQGHPCKLVAGWGTDHHGEGRCKFHGGASTGPPKGSKNARKHGTWETVVKDQLSDEERELYEQIEDIHDLNEELKILRYKLIRLLQPVEREQAFGLKDRVEKVTLEVDEVEKSRAIAILADSIRKVVKDMQALGSDDGSLDVLVQFAESVREEYGDE